jgi:hypothetical protein
MKITVDIDTLKILYPDIEKIKSLPRKKKKAYKKWITSDLLDRAEKYSLGLLEVHGKNERLD